MSGQISKAEGWSAVSKAYQNINFSAYDYESIKRSLIDYIKTYHPENFNDYIENSEVIAMIETFAYVGQQLAYRQDMNAHENFITTASRKQSVLRLAKYISYNANRNLPPRGLVKINTIESTEEVYDSKGTNLANRRIIWNDTNNPNWREQFFIVMNLIMEQQYGTVAPTDRTQVDDVVFELYRLKNRPTPNGILKYSATSSGQTFPMELVPVTLTQDGPQERRPAKNEPLSILYGSDGLGDSSDTTGFFLFTKEGTLNKINRVFDGITPNQTIQLNATNVNDIDVWVNNIDPETGETISDSVIDPLGRRLHPKGEWVQVDSANVENIIYNTNLNRNKFETETLEGDDVRIIFGDGEFADIPGGTFDIWYRTSTAGDSVILQNSVVNKRSSLSYLNHQQKLQTFTFTFSLISSLTNGAAAEDIERIRKFAPSIYYTQDRMVNGRDYNNYPLQNQAIAKLRTINRTFAGDSKYLAWHDPSEHYEDVKLFGDDLSVYYEVTEELETVAHAAPLFFVRNTIQPLLSSSKIMIGHAMVHLPPPAREFNANDLGVLDVNSNNTLLGEMQKGLSLSNTNFTLYMCYRPVYTAGNPAPLMYNWVTFNDMDVEIEPSIQHEATFKITHVRQESKWEVRFKAGRQIVKSPTTKFWFNNAQSKEIVEDTLNPHMDQVVILKANINAAQQMLKRNIPINVIGNVYSNGDVTIGQQDNHALSVISPDDDGDGLPDDILCGEIFQQHYVNVNFPVNQVFALSTAFGGTGAATNVIAGNDELVAVINGKRFVSTLSPTVEREPVEITPEVRYNYALPKMPNNSDVVDLTKNNILDSQKWYTFDEMKSPTEKAQPGDIVTHIRFNLDPISNPQTNAQRAYNAFIQRSPFNLKLMRNMYAYMQRINGKWVLSSSENTSLKLAWIRSTHIPTDEVELTNPTVRGDIKKVYGSNSLNFAWFHRTPRYHVVDPSVTNIVDMFVITRGYYDELRKWVNGVSTHRPTAPSTIELRNTLGTLLRAGMISDAIVVHSGKFKILFGSKAQPELRATFKVVRSQNATITTNEMKVRVMEIIRNFFNIEGWEFGETFYFTELSAAIHAGLASEIESVVLVPNSASGRFGELFEIAPQEDELFIPDINIGDIEVVDHLDVRSLRMK